MNGVSILCVVVVVVILVAVCGCTKFHQGTDEVLVRDPTVGCYGEPQPAANLAANHWEFAAMSENAYQEGRTSVRQKATEFKRALSYSPEMSEVTFDAACKDEKRAIPISGWQRWDFPGKPLQSRMLAEGMYVEVLERSTSPHTIAVIFEGTNFSELPDWKANLRWFLRFVPGYQDQYVIAAQDIAREFLSAIASQPDGRYQVDSSTGNLQDAEGEPIRIVTVGHSLGGGLAQHFAYTLKQPENGTKGPKVSEVFAFDPSPVTGWFTVPDPPRSYNANGLLIHRVFEHGEILAYIRLLTSRLAGSRENPAIWEYRYNFDRNANIVGNHSMRRLACGLVRASKPWESRITTQ